MPPRTQRPSSSNEVVGKRPLWELWADTQAKTASRGQELIDAGAFTTTEFAFKMGWTIDKATHHLKGANLKRERASDPRGKDGRNVWFYFAPSVKEKTPR